MSFTEEQIMDYQEYQKICECFLSLSANEEMSNKLKEILYKGQIGSFSPSVNMRSKNNPSIERRRRVSLAYLLINDPETFDFIVQNNINIFHGTNANALPSILKYGLNSVDALKEKGITASTGEEWSRVDGKRSFVSFTDVLDVSRDYSEMSSKNGQDCLSFPVIFGTNEEVIKEYHPFAVASELPEIGVNGEFPKEGIQCIFVPKDKIQFVQKLVGSLNIPVLSISNYERRFYYIDEFGFIDIFLERFENFKQNQKQESKRNFSLQELKETVKKCSLKKIQELLNSIKNKWQNLPFEEKELNDGRKI